MLKLLLGLGVAVFLFASGPVGATTAAGDDEKVNIARAPRGEIYHPPVQQGKGKGSGDKSDAKGAAQTKGKAK
jgi:hypothetical protein